MCEFQGDMRCAASANEVNGNNRLVSGVQGR